MTIRVEIVPMALAALLLMMGPQIHAFAFIPSSTISSRTGAITTPSTALLAFHENVVSTIPVSCLQDGMKMKKIPSSDLVVSEICLGTMTFGEQLTKEQGFAQLDMATKELGINFIDTAESYPVPSAPTSTGASERIIGEWLKRKGNKRQNVIISTKICGFSDQITWCRRDGEGTRINRKQVIEAVDAQLERLGTDYIDLLQFHWPDRYVPLFGAPEYLYDLERNDGTPIREQLEIINDLVKAGKVRSFGLSNETPYGATAFCKTAELLKLPRPCCVQNAYNLLVRNDYESGMLESCSPTNNNMVSLFLIFTYIKHCRPLFS